MIVEPYIAKETEDWAIVFKPHGMPSAPLSEGEVGNLVSWFAGRYPESDAVRGIKPVERGLVHRLDTATEGLVLLAKKQSVYDSLRESQNKGLIGKKYVAFCSGNLDERSPGERTVPFTIESEFRAWGPGRKEVRPIFPGNRGYTGKERSYRTVIVDVTESSGATEQVKATGDVSLCPVISVTCYLIAGYRHQIRAHLAFSGIPILGDTLYHPLWKEIKTKELVSIPLQLHAIEITFPDPIQGETVVFSLPQPDRMSL